MDLVGFPCRKGSPESVESAILEGEIDRLGREGLCVVNLVEVEPAGTRTSR